MTRGRGHRTDLGAEAASLWRIALSPTIWALHFVACYATAAVWCAKADLFDLSTLRIAIAGYTVFALGLISWLAWRAWVQWDFLDDLDHDHAGEQAEHRHEFLGHAAFLLSGLSLVGVIYVAMPAFFAASCT